MTDSSSSLPGDAMAPGSPVIIDEALRKRRQRKIIVRSVFGSLAAVLVLLVVLYFILPVFRLSHSSFYGCGNFTAEDVVSLSGYSSSSSYLFVSDGSVEENIVANSNGLIRNVESDVGFFSGEIFVQEDYPVCTLASDSESEPRYPSGRTHAEVMEAASSIPLDDEALEAVKEGLENDYADSSLPLLYMPDDADDSLVSLSIEALGGIPKNTINAAYAVQFDSSMSSSMFDSNLLDVLFSFEEGGKTVYVVLEEIRVEEITIVFADDRIIDEAIPAIEEAVNESGSQLGNLGTYELHNPDLTLENVYHFKVDITNGSTIEINRVNQ